MLTALDQNMVISLNKFKLDFATIKNKLNHYLNNLEQCLIDLANEMDSETILKASSDNDLQYSKEILPMLVETQLWMAKRHIIIPKLPTKKSIFGMLIEENKISKKERRSIHKEISRLTMIANKEADGSNGELSQLGKKYSAYLSRLPKDDDFQDEASKRKWVRAFNILVTDPLIMQYWSVPLFAIDPRNGKFREIIFLYV